jgi:hypothetical protein
MVASAIVALLSRVGCDSPSEAHTVAVLVNARLLHHLQGHYPANPATPPNTRRRYVMSYMPCLRSAAQRPDQA